MLSVIIPTLNEETSIENAINSIRAQQLNTEIIISDGGSTDKTIQIAKKNGAKIVKSRKGRGTQMRNGARKARGNILFFMHADTKLSAGALLAGTKKLMEGYSAVGFIKIFPRAKGIMNNQTITSEMWPNVFGFIPGDQGLLLTTKMYKSIKGFSDIPLMEDVEISTRLKKKGEIGLCSKKVITSARRFEKDGLIKTSMLMIYLFTLYKLGADPVYLREKYIDIR